MNLFQTKVISGSESTQNGRAGRGVVGFGCGVGRGIWPVVVGALAMGGVQGGPVSYAPGDLFLGVRAAAEPGSVVAYVVNIGAAATFREASSSFTVSGLGDLAADLEALFGPDWHSRSDVYWSISGTPGPEASGGDPARTLYASSPRPAPGETGPVLIRRNFSGQAAPANKMTSLAVSYLQAAGVPRLSTDHSPVAITQTVTEVNGYQSFHPGGSSYGYFTPSIEGGLERDGVDAALDLYRLPPAPSGMANTPGERVGSFVLDDEGRLSFEKVEPELAPEAVGIVYTGATALVTFSGSAGRDYRIERSPSLEAGSWTALSVVTADPGGSIAYEDAHPLAETAFYRAVAP